MSSNIDKKLMKEDFISYKQTLLLCQSDKIYANDYLQKLFSHHFPNYKELIIENPLLSIMTFYPLPNEFNINILGKPDTVVRKKDYYFFCGIPGDRILFGNRKLPIINKDPIPFLFPIVKDNKTKTIISNTFYFEITLGYERFRKEWQNECISIGYGSIDTSYKNQVGWTPKSWGFHSDDGTFLNHNISKAFCDPWKPNDTMGVGLKYISKNNYLIFLTRNGLIVNDEETFSCESELVPMIGLDSSYPVFVNWGQNAFKFDIEKYSKSSEILSSNNTYLSNNQNLDNYNVTPKFTNKNLLFNYKIGSPSGILNALFSEIEKLEVGNNSLNQSDLSGNNTIITKSLHKSIITDISGNWKDSWENGNKDSWINGNKDIWLSGNFNKKIQIVKKNK